MAGKNLLGYVEVAVELLDVGIGRCALRMRRLEPSSVGSTTVQI
jgi:hypothetical protein